jgi:hypothetical protein
MLASPSSRPLRKTFVSLDQPERVAELIGEFSSRPAAVASS